MLAEHYANKPPLGKQCYQLAALQACIGAVRVQSSREMKVMQGCHPPCSSQHVQALSSREAGKRSMPAAADAITYLTHMEVVSMDGA